MRPSGLLSAVVVRGLLVVLALVAAAAIVQHVVYRTSSIGQEEIAGEHFHSLLNDGEKAVQVSRYREGLDSFRKAEHTLPRMIDAEYAALKNSRMRLARVGGSIGAEAYADLAKAAVRQGTMLEPDADAALPKFQDAEEFALQMSGEQQATLISARAGMVRCLTLLKRYSEAAEAAQRMIDYLKANDPESPAIAAEEMTLVTVYSAAEEWPRAEEEALQASSSAERNIAQLRVGGTTGSERSIADAVAQKDAAAEALVNVYWHEQKTDLALSTAEVFYNQAAESHAAGGSNPRQRIARLALDIAMRSDRREDAQAWQQRLAMAR